MKSIWPYAWLFWLNMLRWVSKPCREEIFSKSSVFSHLPLDQRAQKASAFMISLGVDPGSLVVVPSFNSHSGIPQNRSSVFTRCISRFQYFIYSCILGLISCSVFLRVNYELKMLIMMAALVGYNTIFLHTHAPLLDDYSQVLFER